MIRNLYVFAEAGRCWYEKSLNIFDKIGLQSCKADLMSAFIKNKGVSRRGPEFLFITITV